MSTSSKANPNPPADLETGTARSQTAAAQEVAAVVNPEMARSIRASLDVFFVVYLLFFIGLLAVMVMVSDHWWDPWPAVLVLSPIFIGTLWMTPMMKDVYVDLYATEHPSGTDGNLRTNLLASQT
ncbi:hypothetical protein EJB05_25990 [Eragrostis curvula]|uniref:Uncharacterized protein n=1 Tax=Eragrostis curvula TaxID=38414 RepID=A0A5J9UJP7_9POAL|nr:hypothetical protein EJB05_25990 [Eragrostis curvula]